MKLNRKLFSGLLLILLFLCAAVLFGVYDLSISERLFNDKNAFARGMEDFGVLVEPYLMILSGLTLAVYFITARDIRIRPLKLLFSVLCVLGGLAYSGVVYGRLGEIGRIAALIVTCILAGLWTFWLSRCHFPRLYQMMQIAAITAFYIIAALLVVQVLKMLWGRVRFRELKDLSEFTSWFLPQGMTGHHSFPSGHTSNAASLWVVTLFIPLVEKKWQKFLCGVLPALWIAAMAFSRVIAGAHYASDTLFGAAVTIALFYPIRHAVLQRTGALSANSTGTSHDVPHTPQ